MPNHTDREPGESGVDDVNMEPETSTEQTRDSVYKPDSMFEGGPSASVKMYSLPVMQFIKSELKSPEEITGEDDNGIKYRVCDIDPDNADHLIDDGNPDHHWMIKNRAETRKINRLGGLGSYLAFKDFCQPREPSSMRANRSISSTEASSETSTITDHEITPAELPNETSTAMNDLAVRSSSPEDVETSTAINELTVRSSSPENVEIKPFNYPACPPTVRRQILRYLLRSDHFIIPWYNFGSLQVSADESSRQNFTNLPQSFAGNAELLDEATTVLYRDNSFSLHRAAVCLWWLRRIGPNISKLRDLTLSLEEGNLDRFGTRPETLWLSIVHLLSQNSQLKTLAVSFAGWRNQTQDTDGLDPAKDASIVEPRNAIITTLLSLRGLEQVRVKAGKGLPDHCKQVMEEALLLDEGVTNEDVLQLERDLKGPERAKYSFA